MTRKNYSEVMKKTRAEFTAMVNGNFNQEYAIVLNKTVAQFSALAGNNYSFTPAIPTMIQGRKYEIYFAYRIAQDRTIPRPYLKLATDYMTGNIVEFKNAAYSDFADTEKYPREKNFNANVPVAKTAREQMTLLKNLQATYEKVRVLAFNKELSNEEQDILAEYVKALKDTVPSDLLAFCVDTEPKFFEWLRLTIGVCNEQNLII